eukprot:Gb_25144 [translate_table: standard]
MGRPNKGKEESNIVPKPGMQPNLVQETSNKVKPVRQKIVTSNKGKDLLTNNRRWCVWASLAPNIVPELRVKPTLEKKPLTQQSFAGKKKPRSYFVTVTLGALGAAIYHSVMLKLNKL